MLKNKKGTTFIELVLAMVMIAIAVVTTLDFYKYCQKSFITNSKLKMAAADFASETTEEVYMLDFVDPKLNTTDENGVVKSLPSQGDFADLATQHEGTRAYFVSQTDVTSSDSYKVVEIKVCWNP